MDWTDLYSKAFPKKKSFEKHSWPDLPGPKAGEAGNLPQLKKPGPGEGGQWPALAGPAATGGEGFPAYNSGNVAPSNDLPKVRISDHIGDFGFRVEIGGLYVGGFTKVEGLTSSVEVIEFQHGNDITPRKRMGRIKVENVRLIKGYINDPFLYKWCESAMRGDIQRKSMSIVLLDDTRMGEIARYNLFEVWPTKWSGFKLDAMGRGALVEEIELVVERLDRA